MKHKKSRERYSLLMAISNKKIESYKIIKGSVDSIIYLDFYKENTQLFKTSISRQCKNTSCKNS